MQQVTPNDDIAERPTKRRRKILACLDCRKRKVQCDRKYPVCTRCEKSGRTELCTYGEDGAASFEVHEETIESAVQQRATTRMSPSVQGIVDCDSVTVSKDVWNDLLGRLLRQERTIVQLQDHDRTPTRYAPRLVTPRSTERAVECPHIAESIMFRRKAFHTQFYGQTDTRKLFIPGVELHSFTRSAFEQSPALSAQVRHIRGLEKARKSARATSRLPPVKDLKTLLPPQQDAERLINRYIHYVDSAYCILHVPSFREENDAFWHDFDTHTPSFACLLLLMMACVLCFDRFPDQKYIATSSVQRDLASHWIESCEVWLSKESAKHIRLVHWQIRCLILLAKKMNRVKAKRSWTETGNLLNLLMVSGFHRRAELIMNPTSVFEREMRRRIWAFALEFDLDAAIDRGLPCHSSVVRADVESPSNIHDNEFGESSTTLPETRPVGELTRATWLHISARSIALRKNLTTVLNEPDLLPSHEDVLSYTRELEKEIDTIRQWSSNNDSRRLDGASSGVALLELQLQQYMCILHGLTLRRSNDVGLPASFSVFTFANAAQTIIDIHIELGRNGNYALLLSREDPLRIASWVPPVAIKTHDLPPSGSRIHQWTAMLTSALEMVAAKSFRLGTFEPPVAFSFSHLDFVRYNGKLPAELPALLPGFEQLGDLIKHIADHQDVDFLKSINHDARNVRETRPEISSTSNDTSAVPLNTDGDDFAGAGPSNFAWWEGDEWMFDTLAFDVLPNEVGLS